MSRPLPAPRSRPLPAAALLLALLPGVLAPARLALLPAPPAAVAALGPPATAPRAPVSALPPPAAAPVVAGAAVGAGTAGARAVGGDRLVRSALPVSAGPAAGWRAPTPGPVRLLRPFTPGPERWSPGHRGVDLALVADAPVLAAGPGRVVFAGLVAGRGVVSVSHGELRTTYEPVVPVVSAGDVVQGGEVVGVLAPGHVPCRECLHWGLRRGEHYLDPLRLLRPARVRLLPLSSTTG